MHSTVVRAQNVFGFFTSVAFTVAAAIALSVALLPQSPQASLELKNVQVVKGRPHYYSNKKEEYAHIRFDLDTDLTSVFNWNAKQIFLYVTATYPSESPSTVPPSEAIIWDAIIPADNAPWHPNTYIHPTPKSASSKSKPKKGEKRLAYPPGAEPGIVRLSGQKPKYQIADVSGKMAERQNATLTLRWNVQPWVGALLWSNRDTLGRWQGLKGGQSETFDLPQLKGTEAKKDDPKTETGAERNRGSPG